MKTYEASTDASRLRFAIVVGRFNHLVSARLLEEVNYTVTLALRPESSLGSLDGQVLLGTVTWSSGSGHLSFSKTVSALSPATNDRHRLQALGASVVPNAKGKIYPR